MTKANKYGPPVRFFAFTLTLSHTYWRESVRVFALPGRKAHKIRGFLSFLVSIRKTQSHRYSHQLRGRPWQASGSGFRRAT